MRKYCTVYSYSYPVYHEHLDNQSGTHGHNSLTKEHSESVTNQIFLYLLLKKKPSLNDLRIAWMD